MPQNLIRNAIKTPDGTVLQSFNRHDYKSHVDANGKTYVVDGGLDYLRGSMHGDERSMVLYDNEPHEIQRDVLAWGSYGKNGDQPLRRIRISDMETEHIEAVLRECNPTLVFRNCLQRELEMRGEV